MTHYKFNNHLFLCGTILNIICTDATPGCDDFDVKIYA